MLMEGVADIFMTINRSVMKVIGYKVLHLPLRLKPGTTLFIPEKGFTSKPYTMYILPGMEKVSDSVH